jgi:hypothetical protein
VWEKAIEKIADTAKAQINLHGVKLLEQGRRCEREQRILAPILAIWKTSAKHGEKSGKRRFGHEKANLRDGRAAIINGCIFFLVYQSLRWYNIGMLKLWAYPKIPPSAIRPGER